MKKLVSRTWSLWVSVLHSFWFLPGLLVAFSVALGWTVPWLDRHWLDAARAARPYFFGGNAEAARALLSAIAASLSTVVSIAFSITIVALQQASMQYSPRVLANFSRDRMNQWVLGIHIGTVVYSLLVLRDVRGDADNPTEFVPALSVTFSLVLAVASLSMLVFFLHHISVSLRVPAILRLIRRELDDELKRAYPDALCGDEARETGDGAEADAESHRFRRGYETAVLAPREGYLSDIAVDALVGVTAGRGLGLVYLPCRPGAYVVPGEPLVRCWSDRRPDSDLERDLLRTLLLTDERSTPKDALYGIEQIRDVALKALSPAVNNPSTAVECLHHLKGAIAILLRREIPPALRTIDGTRYHLRRPSFVDYLETAFTAIAWNAKDNPPVLSTMASCLGDLARLAPALFQRRALHEMRKRLCETELSAKAPPTARGAATA